MADLKDPLLIEHAMAMLVHLGQADFRCEALRLKAHEETDPLRKKNLSDAALIAQQQLEIIADQVIELGRAISDKPAPEIPEQLPDAVIGNEDTTYRGKEAVEEIPPSITTLPGTPRGQA